MRRILITAGPTWVAIDKVRIISNISSGKTGLLLARLLRRYGKVFLLIGPVGRLGALANIKVYRFCYFKELEELLKEILKRYNFDIVIHTAAVSDYKPRYSYPNKISSSLTKLKLELIPTPKLAKMIKFYQPNAYLIIFKLENSLSSSSIKKTKEVLLSYRADLAILNTFNKYQALILDKEGLISKSNKKETLVKNLINALKDKGLI